MGSGVAQGTGAVSPFIPTELVSGASEGQVMILQVPAGVGGRQSCVGVTE